MRRGGHIQLRPRLSSSRWGRVASCLLLLLLLACSEAENLFDSYPVFFVIQMPRNVEVLMPALTSPGEFCTVENKGDRVVCRNLKGTESYINKSAADLYKSFNFGRSTGFVVGHTNAIANRLPNQVVCYDIVCRNCYDNGLSANVKLLSGSRAQCPKCLRTYDLNELGMASEGHPLFRYRVSSTDFTLTIGHR